MGPAVLPSEDFEELEDLGKLHPDFRTIAKAMGGSVNRLFFLLATSTRTACAEHLETVEIIKNS